MPFGYNGKILRVDLAQMNFSVDEPDRNFYRRYFGGNGFVGYYLLKELKPEVDPLDPDNELIFATGVVTGAPVGGTGRNSVGAKSPLTNGYGVSEVGGYWGVELKRTGYDAVIIRGRAEQPVYVWIKDGIVKVRDARHLWGKLTGESHKIIQQELGDSGIRIAQIGPAGEKLIPYANICHDLTHFAGRTGMGAVMGSKNLKAIAIRGHNAPPLADPGVISSLAKWLRGNFMELSGLMYDQGTASLVASQNAAGGLPTRNFQEGFFEEAEKINGETYRDTILVARRGCWACPIRCKREVKTGEPYSIDPAYGGPEFEALASLGSNCGISNLAAIVKANELCNAYGLDTISTGANIAFAMECAERGILNKRDAGGLEIRFGDSEVMLKLVGLIARREGIGNLLAEGMAKAAPKIGQGAERYALHVKGQPIPMHEPRHKQGLGLGYAVCPTGADHIHNLIDTSFIAAEGRYMREIKGLGILEPLPAQDLSTDKVRMLIYHTYWRHLQSCLLMCVFVPFNHGQVAEMVRGVTGWNSTVWELMKVGERSVQMAHAFNIREGFSKEDDWLPQRFFTPLPSGPLEGVSINKGNLEQARDIYYSMMGWSKQSGAPQVERLEELQIEWVADELEKYLMP